MAFYLASLAQLVEQLTLNQWVAGSSPAGSTFFRYVVFKERRIYCKESLELLLPLIPHNRFKKNEVTGISV